MIVVFQRSDLGSASMLEEEGLRCMIYFPALFNSTHTKLHAMSEIPRSGNSNGLVSKGDQDSIYQESLHDYSRTSSGKASRRKSLSSKGKRTGL